MRQIRTLEDAYEFVQEIGICTLFSGKSKGIVSLWGAVDLPENGGGKTKWGARVEAIWAWKNELPEVYPDEVYYGKIPGGHAALMSMRYLRETHYPNCHKPVAECSELARHVYEIIRLNPSETSEARAEAMEVRHCSKSRFDSALKELQITLNVVRSNEPGSRRDSWLPFREVYLEFCD